MPLYEVAVLEVVDKVTTTEKGTSSKKEEKLIFGPVAVCATNEQGAIAAATVNAPTGSDRSAWQVLVRPFSRA